MWKYGIYLQGTGILTRYAKMPSPSPPYPPSPGFHCIYGREFCFDCGGKHFESEGFCSKDRFQVKCVVASYKKSFMEVAV